jgi:hypothetical protein
MVRAGPDAAGAVRAWTDRLSRHTERAAAQLDWSQVPAAEWVSIQPLLTQCP